MVRTTAIASLVGALALAAPGLALAGNGNSSAGSGKSPSSIVLAQPGGGSVAASSTSWPRYGDMVTFDISTTETAYPYVNLKCYQNGQLVAEGWEGYFDGALGDRFFGLYSPIWTGGAADCTAWLDKYANGRWKQLASTSFHVSE
jgi:hypothetical protein